MNHLASFFAVLIFLTVTVVNILNTSSLLTWLSIHSTRQAASEEHSMMSDGNSFHLIFSFNRPMQLSFINPFRTLFLYVSSFL